MTRHFNPSIVNRAQRILNSKGTDTIGDEISGPFAIVDINVPKENILSTISRTTSGTATILTTSANEDTWVTGFLYSYIKDATCDVADGILGISFTIDGKTQTHNLFPVLTTTAQYDAVFVKFTKAMRIDRNTSITFNTSTYTVGKMIRTVSIYGYTEAVTSN